MIESFSQGCRLAADIHHDASMTRRNLLLGNMTNFSKAVKDAIKDTEIGEFLFGPNLLETIKAAKVSESATKGNNEQRTNFHAYKSKNGKRPLGNKRTSPLPSGRHLISAPKMYQQSRPQRPQRSFRKEKGQSHRSKRIY